jgi:DNA topoisomerase-1
MVHAKAETEPSEYTCPNCGKEMVYRWSKNGRYLACTGYPDCKTTFPVDRDGKKLQAKHVDVACPKCGGSMVLRRGRFGPFLSCAGYPDCDGIVNLDKKGRVKLPSARPLEVDLPCPKCGKPLYLRRGRRGPWLSCSAFPKCRSRVGWRTLTPAQRKQLEGKLAEHERENPQPVVRKRDGAPVGQGYVPQVLVGAHSDGEPSGPK